MSPSFLALHHPSLFVSSVFRRNCDSDCSDGEEDFYYTEIKLNTDSVADGLSSLSPVSPSVLSPPPPPPSPLPLLSQLSDPHRPPQCSDTKEPHAGGTTPLSRSAPSALYLIHTDHAYQVNTHSRRQDQDQCAAHTVKLDRKIKGRCTLWINIHTTTHLSGHTQNAHILSHTLPSGSSLSGLCVIVFTKKLMMSQRLVVPLFPVSSCSNNYGISAKQQEV